MQNEDKEINAINEIVNASEKALYELTQESFMTFISTTMEMYSMKRGVDVTEIAQGVAGVVTFTHMASKGATS